MKSKLKVYKSLKGNTIILKSGDDEVNISDNKFRNGIGSKDTEHYEIKGDVKIDLTNNRYVRSFSYFGTLILFIYGMEWKYGTQGFRDILSIYHVSKTSIDKMYHIDISRDVDNNGNVDMDYIIEKYGIEIGMTMLISDPINNIHIKNKII